MLKSLLRVQLRGLVASFMRKQGASSKRKKKTGKAAGKPGKGTMTLFVLLMIYCALAFGFLFYLSFSQLAVAFRAAGIGWLYFAMYAIFSFALMFIGSIFMTKAQLFEAKDNERLLAMPIKPRDILLSRMVVLVLFNLAFGLVVAAPAAIAWILAGGFSLMGAVSFVLLSLALVLFALALSVLFAWLLTLITSRMRRSALVSVVLSIIFLGLYMVACMRMQTYVMALAASGEKIATSLSAVTPLYWLGLAMAQGEVLPLLYALVVLILPFVLAFWLLARSFIRIITTKRGHAKIRYEHKAMKAAPADRALLRREWRRFATNASYMLNAGMGALFQIALAVFVIVKRDTVAAFAAAISMDGGMLAVVAVLGSMMMQAMNLISAPSVSLEGKQLWIVRSMPISSWQVLRTKRQFSALITTIPCAAMAVGLWIALALTPMQGALVLAVSLLSMLLLSDLGLIEGLRHANLAWDNPAQAVKQGMAVLFTMLIGWGVSLAVGLVYFLLAQKFLSAEVFLGILCVLFAVCEVLAVRYLQRGGVRRFEAL